MKTFIQPGDVLSLTAPYALTAGQGLLVGTIVGVATFAAANGAPVEAAVSGVFDVPKTTGQAWSVGALVYWDNSGRLFTTTSAGNTLCGKIVAAALSADTVGRIRLQN